MAQYTLVSLTELSHRTTSDFFYNFYDFFFFAFAILKATFYFHSQQVIYYHEQICDQYGKQDCVHGDNIIYT